MKSILSIVLTLGFGVLCAQDRPGVYFVKSGSDLGKILPYEARFQFGEFVNGEVLFRNGRKSQARLNYSLVHGQIMFISPTRDTMLLTNPELVRLISLNERSYYYQENHGHVEITKDFGNIKLGKKEYVVRLGQERYASYDQYSSTSAISSYSSFTNGNGEFSFLQGRDKIIMKRREKYFLVDKNNEIYLANRASLTKVFPSHKSAINKFLKANTINMESEQDLLKTLEFCSTLAAK